MHGGAAAGIVPCLTTPALGAAPERFRIRLHAPPPLQTPLGFSVEASADGQSVTFAVGPDDAPILTGTAFATSTAAAEEPVVSLDAVERLAGYVAPTDAQMQRYNDFVDVEDNPDFTGCFGCGPANPDGLGLRTRPIDDEVSFVHWDPPERWRDGTHVGWLASVAALDCTSAFPLKQFGLTGLDEAALLGSYEAEVHRRPPAQVDGGFRIVTSPHQREGRKILADIGLFDRTGEVYITGRATWIVLT